jgi:hypothetical protein
MTRLPGLSQWQQTVSSRLPHLSTPQVVIRNVSIALRQIVPEFRVHRRRQANDVNRPQDSRPPGQRPAPLRCPPWTLLSGVGFSRIAS